MEASQPQPPLMNLSDSEQHLYDALRRMDKRLATMYLGSIVVLIDNGNPDKYALAAHNLRELMEKMPEYVNAPTEVRNETLANKVRELESKWYRTLNDTQNYNGGHWMGQIDHHLLRWLVQVEQFFKWLRTSQATRKRKAASLVRGLGLAKSHYPEALVQIRANEWAALADFFVGVCHHGKVTTLHEFEQRKSSLERFLLSYLMPPASADFDAIDDLIEGGQGSARR